MDPRIPPTTGEPPKTSHTGALVATGVLLAAWFGATLFADQLVGPITAIADAVELWSGLDVVPESPE